VTDWSTLLLGVIAAATLVMALVQVGMIVAVLRIGRRAQATMTTVHEEIRPVLAKVSAVADEASRTATLATAQAEKIDRLITDLSRRVEETAAVVQDAIITPAREGKAIIAAVKAGLAALRGGSHVRPRHGRQAEEEDPLFIG
jgi:hypothetical protein